MAFSDIVLHWYDKNKREFPWRKTKSTYNVWVSEIVLQQTQTSQGLSYYSKLIDTFPTVKDLAKAKEEKVLKLWQGLGYYSRARNLHATAKYIHYNLSDVFPNNYNDLIELKGIGPYTAAAISSICYNEKRAVVDGNVYRILARVFNNHTAINSHKGVKIFQKLADSLIGDTDPGDYNQGLMDIGATICTPKIPKCSHCPFTKICIAQTKDTINLLPIKIGKTKIKQRYFNYFFVLSNDEFLMKQRKGNDIWKNLYEFPLIELNESPNGRNININKVIKSIIGNKSFEVKKKICYEHKLSHQKLNITINYIKTTSYINKSTYIKVNRMQALNLPVPKPIEKFIQELFNSLDCKT